MTRLPVVLALLFLLALGWFLIDASQSKAQRTPTKISPEKLNHPLIAPPKRCPGARNYRLNDRKMLRVVACMVSYLRKKKGLSPVRPNMASTKALKRDLRRRNRICLRGPVCPTLAYGNFLRSPLASSGSYHMTSAVAHTYGHPARRGIMNTATGFMLKMMTEKVYVGESYRMTRAITVLLDPGSRRIAVARQDLRDPGSRNAFNPKKWFVLPSIFTTWQVALDY